MEKILVPAGIIPVITPLKYEQTHNIVHALNEGGISTIEIVLRTSVALDILAKIVQDFKNCVIGAGTVISTSQMEECKSAGAQFVVTPGNTRRLLEKAKELQIPILPGTACPSDIMRALDYGIKTVKLFPANLVGGPKALNAYHAVFPEVKFCPTGGINLNNLKAYYEMKNVIALGGSWLTPDELVLNDNWQGITKLAQHSLSLLNLLAH